ncbi:MAG: hypothetical protein NUV57_00715 [archaeon]|nr:hypothetical protein [archaeon]
MVKESIFDSLKKQLKKPGQQNVVAQESISFLENSKQQKPASIVSNKSRASLFERENYDDQKRKLAPEKPKSKGLFDFLKPKPKPVPQNDSSQTIGSAFENKPFSLREDIGSQPHELKYNPIDKTTEIISKIGGGYDEDRFGKESLETNSKPKSFFSKPIETKPVEPKQVKPVQAESKSFEPIQPKLIEPIQPVQQKPFIPQSEQKTISAKDTIGESFSSKVEPAVKKVVQKNAAAPENWTEENASTLAREILDSRMQQKVEYKQKESNLLNLIVILLIVVGLVVLASIWYFYLGGS